MALLPLADANARGGAGWCTYASTLEDAPDCEIMCGGWNSKRPTAAGVWRQGNLLHFGFQQDPSQLNASGRDLLENAVAYIAGFRGDRPLGVVHSGFGRGPRSERRLWLGAVLDNDRSSAAEIADRFFPDARRERLAAMDKPALREWVQARWQYIVPVEDGRLDVCPDLQALGVDVYGETFLTGVRAALAGDEERRAAACRVLHRHCPDGPRGSTGPASAAEWSAFVEANAPYLFFSEAAGCRWLVDTLAKARGVASKDLRGPARRG